MRQLLNIAALIRLLTARSEYAASVSGQLPLFGDEDSRRSASAEPEIVPHVTEEERALGARYGAVYAEYCRAVRRWL